MEIIFQRLLHKRQNYTFRYIGIFKSKGYSNKNIFIRVRIHPTVFHKRMIIC